MSVTAHEAVLSALEEIDVSEFQATRDGWRDEISVALLDAVFSIRSRYDSPTPGKGVWGRVNTFRNQHADKLNDLKALEDLGEDAITDIMGATQTAGRPKSQAVIEAAQALQKAGIQRAGDISEDTLGAAKAAYTGVHGLGWITFEYFLMLLGKPGIKADTMIVRFVNSALDAANLDRMDARQANQLLKEVFRDHNQDHWGGLTSLDHAIWRFQRSR